MATTEERPVGGPRRQRRFERNPDLADVAYPTPGITDPARVLHICSGSVWAPFTVDRRAGVRSAVIADARALPFQDAEVAGSGTRHVERLVRRRRAGAFAI